MGLNSKHHWRSHFVRATCGLALTVLMTGCEGVLESLVDQLPQVTQRSPQPPLGSGAQSLKTEAMEAIVYERINLIRQQEGLNPLQPNENLAQVARDYSQRMAQEDFFSHTAPDGSTLPQRLQSAGIRYWTAGENLFYGSNVPEPAPLAVRGWMESPGHRANILQRSYTTTGVGVWQDGNTYYFTQLFTRPM